MALSLSNLGSFLSKLAALVQEFAPVIEALEPAQAEKVTAAVAGAIGTFTSTLAGSTPSTTTAP